MSGLVVSESRFEGNNVAVRLQDTDGLAGQPNAYGSNGSVSVTALGWPGWLRWPRQLAS